MIRRVSISFLVILCISTTSVAHCTGTSPAYEGENATVTIKTYNVFAVKDCTTQEEIDQLLYPSGMALPTKYFNLLDMRPLVFSNGYIVSKELKDFLELNYATADNSYTFPEIKAAENYLELVKSYIYPKREGLDIYMVSWLIDEVNMRLLGKIGSPNIANLEEFIKVFVTYEQLLWDLSQISEQSADNTDYNIIVNGTEESPQLSSRIDLNIRELNNIGAIESDIEEIALLLEEKVSYWMYIGINGWRTNILMEWDSDLGAPIVYKEEAAPVQDQEESEITEEPVDIVLQEPEDEEIVTRRTDTLPQREGRTGFRTGITSADVPEKGRNATDILNIACLVLLALGLLVLLIKSIIERLSGDDMSGW